MSELKGKLIILADSVPGWNTFSDKTRKAHQEELGSLIQGIQEIKFKY